MAEYIFKDFLKKKKSLKKYAVSGAGLFAAEGDKMSVGAAAILDELGIKYDKHKARLVTVDVVQNADVIVCMTDAHRQTLVASTAYVYGCGDNTERVVGTASELIGREIPDPYGGSADAYRAAAKDITDMCEPLYGALVQLREALPKFKIQ